VARPCRCRPRDAGGGGAVRLRRGRAAGLCLVVLAAVVGVGAAASVAGDAPGVIWVRPAAGAGAVWNDGPDSAIACLSWPDGLLLVPRGAERLGGPDGAIGVAYGAGRRGFSAGRQVLFTPGRFTVREPLVVTDGSLQLFLSRGELEIANDQLIIRPGGAASGDRRAGLLLLLGMLVIVGVLTVRGRVLARRP